MEYTVLDSYRVRDLVNTQIELRLPLAYEFVTGKAESEETISVVATVTQTYDAKLHVDLDTVRFPESPKVATYLQGGPGFPCGQPLSNSGYTKELLKRGYLVLYMDQRGTGFSTPLEAATLCRMVPKKDGESEEQHSERMAEFLTYFRADSIVEDMERFRKCLLKDTKWTLLGQSFGGFCSFTYLSKYPQSLEAVMVTGGVPPIHHTVDQVYGATYKRTSERNDHYYTKYPQDVLRVHSIAAYLQSNNVVLPNGGTLSVERFQQLGLSFGGSGGTDAIHQIVYKFYHELSQAGSPTYQTLNRIQNQMSFDTNVLYALFQEAIYCDGDYSPSRWGADRLRKEPENHQYVYKPSMKEPLYFTGEMVYQSMFDDYAELRLLKRVAHLLHERTKWTKLYDVEKLKGITWDHVPIVGASYFYDQYVDFDTTMKVKRSIFGHGNLRQYITSEFFHDGIRADSSRVLGALFDLLDADID